MVRAPNASAVLVLVPVPVPVPVPVSVLVPVPVPVPVSVQCLCCACACAGDQSGVCPKKKHANFDAMLLLLLRPGFGIVLVCI